MLDKIIKTKRDRINVLKEHYIINDHFDSKPTKFFQTLLESSNVYKIIGEIKKASPSAGIIKEDFDLLSLANKYMSSGISNLSVLTEEDYFLGQYEYISQIKETLDIKILQKDFIIDEWQIFESYYAGADCILLILAILNDKQLKNFYNLSNKLEMDVICEVHDEEELLRAIKLEVNCIGVNNRNLKTLNIDKNTFHLLSSKIPQKTIKICESGLTCNDDLKKFTKSGADAFLIGETLMRSNNIYEETQKIIKR